MRIAIVGGGISGLSLAYFLEQYSQDQSLQIELYEKESQVGGKIQTSTKDNFIIEKGPDAILLKPQTSLARILKETGLEERIITPAEKVFCIQRKGKLHQVPLTALKKYPKNLPTLWSLSLLSLLGKLEATLTPLLNKSKQAEEASIKSTLSSKYGIEVSKYLYETIFGGVHSGNTEKLSFNALYPSLNNPSKTKDLSKGARFVSFPNGMAELPTTIRENLKNTLINQNTEILNIGSKSEDEIILETSKGSKSYDHIALAIPATDSMKILGANFTELRKKLGQIKHNTSAIITFGILKRELSKTPIGSGYLIPECEAIAVTGCTYSSRKWNGRADEDKLLLRVFLGRDFDTTAHNDEELRGVAIQELKEKLGFSGNAEFSSIQRWSNGLPQYELGHFQRIENIKKSLERTPRLHLTGTSYQGVGVPDCITQAESLSLKILSINNNTDIKYEHTICA